MQEKVRATKHYLGWRKRSVTVLVTSQHSGYVATRA